MPTADPRSPNFLPDGVEPVRVPGRTFHLLLSFVAHELPNVDLDDFTLGQVEDMFNVVADVVVALGKIGRRTSERSALGLTLIPLLCSPGPLGGVQASAGPAA